MNRFFSGLGSAAVCALGFACADSTDPSSHAVTYVLVRVADDPLPTELSRNEYGSTTVLADTIRLEPNGTGIQSIVYESSGVYPQGPTWGTIEIRYRQLGTYIEIEHVCPPNANCLPPPHVIGHRVGRGLRLEWAPTLGGRSPMLYRQVEEDS